MPATSFPLFTPNSVQGFATAADPLALPKGFVAMLKNVRLGDGLVRARRGESQISTSLIGDFRGAAAGQLDGVPYLWRAGYTASKISLYQSDDAGVSFDLITAASSSGPYGDCRLTDISQPVRFQVVRDRGYEPDDEEHDLLIIQNGVDEPRLWGMAATNSTAFAAGTMGMVKITQPPTPPVTTQTSFQTGFPAHYFRIGDATGVPSATGAGISATVGTSPNGRIDIDVTALYTAGSTAIVTFPAGGTPPFPVDLSGPRQLVFFLWSETELFWDSMVIEIGDGATYSRVYSPSLISDAVRVQVDSGLGSDTVLYMVGVPLSDAANDVDLTAIDRFRFTWEGAIPPSGTQQGTMFMAAGSGDTAGGASFAAAWGITDARTIGPAAIETNFVQGRSTGYGSGANYSFGIPNDPRFYFTYNLFGLNPTQAEIDKGVDRAHVYRQSDGESQYYWIASQRLASWDGANWVFDDPPASGQISLPTEGDEVLTLPAYDSAYVCMPTGLPMTTGNGRMFVGQESRLWFSQSEQPFAFRKAVKFFDINNADPTSPGSLAFDGETLQALVPVGSFAGAAESLSSPIAGATTIHLLTNQNMYQLSGFDATSLSRPIPIAPYGTLSPLSVGRSRLGFYWLDNTGEISFFSARGLDRVSVSVVDDITSTIPAARKAWAWGACANDRYYLDLTLDGESFNSRTLVWFERSQTFESFDSSDIQTGAIIPYYDSGYVKLYQFGVGPFLNEYESPTGGDVDFEIDLPELANLSPEQTRTNANEMSVYSDGATAGFTLTCRRVNPNTGAMSDGTITVAALDTDRKVRLEEAGKGLKGDSVRPSIFGTVPSGTKFYSAYIKLERSTTGETRK